MTRRNARSNVNLPKYLHYAHIHFCLFVLYMYTCFTFTLLFSTLIWIFAFCSNNCVLYCAWITAFCSHNFVLYRAWIFPFCSYNLILDCERIFVFVHKHFLHIITPELPLTFNITGTSGKELHLTIINEHTCKILYQSNERRDCALDHKYISGEYECNIYFFRK